MNILSTIGELDPSIQYTNRPTVKVIIKNDDKILLLDEGFLPGGGVDPGEPELEALTRELQEEIGATVKDVQDIGVVVQYRNLIGRKYIVNGYTASLDSIGGPTNPQSDRETQMTSRWLSHEDAVKHVAQSIIEAERLSIDEATRQGILYNLKTVLEFLKVVA